MCRWFAIAALSVFPATALADDWPQWRGPNRDGKSKETGLLTQWPEGGPKLAWQTKDLGKGYSTPSIAKGRIYLIGSPDEKNEHIIALDEKSGTVVWNMPLGKVGKNNGPQYPGPRSTPTVDGDRIYALASDGELVCLDLAGKTVWAKHMRTDFEGKPGSWAYAESPLIDGDVLVVTPGGKTSTMVALNKKDGSLIWKAAVPEGDVSAYASVMISNAGGVKQYVQFVGGGVVGIDAKTGRFLWRYDKTNSGNINISTPIIKGDEVFSTAARAGAGLTKLKAMGDKVMAEQVFFTPKLQNHHGGVVLVGDHVYGTTGSQLVCMEFKTGDVKWENKSVGKGSVCYADGHIYLRAEKGGGVALAEASPMAYKEKGRFTPPDSSASNVWPHPVVANGRLYLRDQEKLYCYDVKK